MARYTTTPATDGTVLIIDTTTGDAMVTSGNQREATMLAAYLNGTAAPRRRISLAPLAFRLLALVPMNRGDHPDIIAARAADTARTHALA